jgi:hypothetical protein
VKQGVNEKASSFFEMRAVARSRNPKRKSISPPTLLTLSGEMAMYF